MLPLLAGMRGDPLAQPRAARRAHHHAAGADHDARRVQRADGGRRGAGALLPHLPDLRRRVVRHEQGGQIRMEEFQALVPPQPRWFLQLVIELAASRCSACCSSPPSSRSRTTCTTRRRRSRCRSGCSWRRSRSARCCWWSRRSSCSCTPGADVAPSEADRADLSRDGRLPRRPRVPALFVLGFPVVLAIGIPCIVYIFANGLPIDLVAQRTLYALDSFPLVAVPVFLFVGSLMNSAGISRYIYRFADTASGACRAACAGEHLRQPDLRRHVGLGAGRHRRPRPHRNRRDAQQGFLRAVRRGRDELVCDRRADLPAVDPAHHLRHRHGRFRDPAAARRNPAGPGVRGDADADDGLARHAAQLSARPSAGRRGTSCGATSSRHSPRSSRR